MGDEKTGSSFWTTLPGILTGFAAVLTAGGGIFLGMHQSGASSQNAKQEAAAARSEAAAPVASPSGGTVTRLNEAPPAAVAQLPGASQGAASNPSHLVQITKLDGSVVSSFEDKFQWTPDLGLASGQTIPFGSIKLVDFGSWEGTTAKLRVTLANGKVVEALSASLPLYASGKNDVGSVSVDMRQVRQLSLPH